MKLDALRERRKPCRSPSPRSARCSAVARRCKSTPSGRDINTQLRDDVHMPQPVELDSRQADISAPRTMGAPTRRKRFMLTLPLVTFHYKPRLPRLTSSDEPTRLTALCSVAPPLVRHWSAGGARKRGKTLGGLVGPPKVFPLRRRRTKNQKSRRTKNASFLSRAQLWSAEVTSLQ